MSDDGVVIQTFVSDRHLGLARWIREKCKQTTHFYDIWHVARTISKKLLKASKEKGCKIISDWMKGIRRHLYWCATSTKAGFGALIKAKWMSFMRHVANKHDGHPDVLFTSCNHGELEPRKWIQIGMLFMSSLSYNSLRKYSWKHSKQVHNDLPYYNDNYFFRYTSI